MTKAKGCIRLVPFILLGVVAIVIAAATFIESRMGSHYAAQHVYGAWWFVLLWLLMVVAACVLLYKTRIWKRLPVMMLHLSFIVILAGALTTHLTSQRGMTHLREGEATRSYWVKDETGAYTLTEEMPFFLALQEFNVLYDADGTTPSDYVSQVVIATTDGEEQATISMNNIGRVRGYRIYQTSFDDDCMGSTFTISYDPWGTAITYAGYLLLAISMVWVSRPSPRPPFEGGSGYLLFRRSTGDKTFISHLHKEGWGGVLVWFAGTAMASYMVIAICMRPLVPVLRSPFLFIHVGTIMLSYILLVVSILRRSLLRPAVFLLATGIFLGAVWANVSWGTYWSWDPKESWALITLIIYSLPLHEKSLPWFRSERNYRLYSLLALASLLMTYFGVNFLLGGMHSYA